MAGRRLTQADLDFDRARAETLRVKNRYEKIVAGLEAEVERLKQAHWSGDWPDDGQYEHQCTDCSSPFWGGKGRAICRDCHLKYVEQKNGELRKQIEQQQEGVQMAHSALDATEAAMATGKAYIERLKAAGEAMDDEIGQHVGCMTPPTDAQKAWRKLTQPESGESSTVGYFREHLKTFDAPEVLDGLRAATEVRSGEGKRVWTCQQCGREYDKPQTFCREDSCQGITVGPGVQPPQPED